ncbi:MAG TPA: TIGR01777 family oxidoreductase [Polyangia bacterium]|nr:TIGR01777 family oxidoreductase [Polyangia bacterium]
MRFLITGATGFIGRHLCEALAAEGHERVVLARDEQRAIKLLPGARVFVWNGKVGLPPEAAFEGVDVVVNLIGETVAERWTEKRKLAIRDSRVLPTRALVERMETLSVRPSALLSMSGVGIYGDRGDEVLTESSRLGNTDGFLVRLAGEWEAAARGAEALGVRVVLLRAGVVLGQGGGALQKMLLPFRLGLGASLGKGQQFFPWVHLDDAVGIILHAAKTAELSGPVNVVGPEPVTNQEFTDALAKTVRRVGRLRVPAFALKALMGEMAEEVLLAGQKISPGRALATDYKFRYPLLTDALKAILPPESGAAATTSAEAPRA